MGTFFKALAPTFPVDVVIQAPGKSADPLQMEVVYKYKTSAELNAYLKQTHGHTDQENLGEVIDSWSGKDVPVYSREALAELLDIYPGASALLFNTYVAESTKARTKN